MLTTHEIEAAAQSLDVAERERVQIGLLSSKHDSMLMEDAYKIQSAWVQKKIAFGRKVIGWKIGLTSRAMQQALNINTPDSGVLFDDMIFHDGETVPGDRFIQPRVEAEVAFIMKAALSPDNLQPADVLLATDYVTPALEILDTRILRADPKTGKSRTIVDTISDNAANAGMVLGTQRFAVQDLDLRWIGAIVSRNDQVEETGLGAGVLNDPALSVVWLAKRLASYGQVIQAGHVVLAGSFIRPIEARRGDKICADFGPYGKINCFFG